VEVHWPGGGGWEMKIGVKPKGAVAQTNRLPFDRLRAIGDILKTCDFSAHAELVEA